MNQATRERKLKFIKSFGANAIRDAVIAALCRHGEEFFLTDEQIDDMTSTQVSDWRETGRRNRQNRIRRVA